MRLHSSSLLNKALLTLSVAGVLQSVLLNNPLWAYSTQQLDRIDFQSTPTNTDITLYSNTATPYHQVSATDTKIMIDFDSVDGSKTIQTNFAGSTNISHVVLQPLDDHRIRLIIKGEDLAPPHINFQSTLATKTASRPSIANNTDTPNATSDMTSTTTTDPNMAEGSYLPESTTSEAPITTDAGPIVAQGPVSKAEQPFTEKLQDNAPIQEVEAAPETGTLAQLKTMMKDWDAMEVAKFGILGALLLALCLFIRHKINEMTRAQSMDEYGQFDQLLEEQSKGKRVSFQDLASAYREDNQQPQLQPAQRDKTRTGKAPLAPERKAPAKNAAKGNDMIGLRSLSRQSEFIDEDGEVWIDDSPSSNLAPRQASPQQAPQPSIDRVSALNKNPMATPPSRQAINQYARQQMAPGKKDAVRRPESPLVNREINRNAEVQKKAQAVAAQRRTPPSNANIPLVQRNKAIAAGRQASNAPANPDIVNFLKDVAGRMEKDGRSNLANAVNKNLRPE